TSKACSRCNAKNGKPNSMPRCPQHCEGLLILMASFGDHILDTARQIALETARREATHLKWATVTATSPVRIRYDGETAASIVPPQTTAAGLSVGDRVQVIKQHGQA